MSKSLFAFFFFLSLTACRVGPLYQTPDPAVPVEWKGATPEGDGAQEVENWWEIFQEAELNELEEQALLNNFNLIKALERVAEARARTGIAASDLYPQLNLAPSYSSTGMLYKIYGVPPGVIPGLKTIFRIHQLQFSLPALLSYELDLWGKYRSLYSAALYDAEAEAAAYGATLLSLTSDLASYYFNLRLFDAQILVLKKTLDLREKTLKLNRHRYEGQIASAIDVSSAELELANTAAQYEDARRQRGLFENAIATLIGIPASDFTLEAQPLCEEPPLIPPGLPSSLLLRRPDIAQAERSMAARFAEINAAYADFFPAITLTGALGYSSPDAQNFLKWKSRYWSYGADANQPLFDGGLRCSNVELAWARFGQAEASYQNQVLVAFQEVEDALNDLEWEAKQYQSYLLAVKAANLTFGYASQRYMQGIATYNEVIDSERSDLAAQLNLLSLLGARYQSTIQLIKALGGSWGCREASCSIAAVGEKSGWQ